MSFGLWKAGRRVRHLLGIDRAVGFTVLARGWTILAGAINILLIARFLNPVEQGYFYTFSSLVALQAVFELGFSFVVLQLAAHESAHLKIEATGVISGDLVAHSRLASVLQKSVRWYTVAAILMAAGLLTIGHWFFTSHQHPSDRVSWSVPWMVISIATTLTFQMDPVFSFLEGCGFVSNVARLRFMQALTGTILAWSALFLHHGLFAPAALVTGQALAGVLFIYSKRTLLGGLLFRSTTDAKVSWTTEIWPFQWRMAVSWICGYFVVPLFNPILFAFRGAQEAGRMGMSTSIVSSLGILAFSWVNTKSSPFGSLIARRDYVSLDRLFFRSVIQSCVLLVAADFVVIFTFLVATPRFPQLTARVLPIPLLAILMLTALCTHVVFCEAAYLRSHKREPLLSLSILVAVLTATNTLIAGRIWGATGISVGYLVWGGVFDVAYATYIFVRCRRQWHSREGDRVYDASL